MTSTASHFLQTRSQRLRLASHRLKDTIMMNCPPRCLPRSVALGLVTAVAALAATTAVAAGQTGPPAAVDGSADHEAQTVGREDPSTPRAVLAAAADELARILEARGDDGVRRGLVSVRDAQDALKAELSGLRPTNLTAAASHVRVAQQALESTVTRGRLQPELEAVARRLAAASRRLAQDIVDVAARADADQRTLATARARIARGDGLTQAGHHSAGAGAYAEALKIASDGLVFDINRFEQEIRDTLDDETVGYSYAIMRKEVLYSARGFGVSRTAADLPPNVDPIPHSPFDQMNIASVTKTITAAAVMKLLQHKGLDLDDSVAPFLPAEWDVPASIQGLTFRDLMTQKSGLGGPATVAATDFATLRTAIEQGIDPVDKTYAYENANFGIFRVIIPALVGVDIYGYGDHLLGFPVGEEAAAAFVASWTYVKYLQDEDASPPPFDPGEVALATPTLPGCSPTDEPQFGPRPLAYGFPDDGTPGVDPGDWMLICGGGGLHMSTVDVARFLARLRYTDQILNADRRKEMTDGFIGYQDPADGWAWNDGEFGTYHSHGGLLKYAGDTKGIGSCAINFPITIQAALVISSIGGDYPHRCAVLANAFDAAWVAQ